MPTATATEKTVRRFQVLRGRHVEGHCYQDPETGEQHLVSQEEYEKEPKRYTPAQFYKGGPFGDIVETDKNLLRFNQPGSTKFKLLAPGERPEPEINDGLEEMTIQQLREYAEDLEIEIPQTTTKKSDIVTIIRAEMQRA